MEFRSRRLRKSAKYVMCFASILTQVFTPRLARANETYVVVKGDTLSSIAHAKLPGHIYGRNGTLQKLVSLNQNLTGHEDRISVGEILTIATSPPVPLRATASAAVETSTTSPSPNIPSNTAPAQIQVPTDVERLADVATPTDSGERSRLHVAPRISFNDLQAVDRSTDGRARLDSDLSYGFELNWNIILSHRNRFVLGTTYDRVDERTTGKTIDPSGFSRARFGLDWVHSFGEDFALAVGTFGESAPFLFATNATTIAITPVLIPEVHLGVKQMVCRTSLFGLSLSADGLLRLPATKETYSVQTGSTYSVSIGVDQLKGSTPLNARVYYERTSQNTSLTDQSESIVGFSLGLDFDLTPKR